MQTALMPQPPPAPAHGAIPIHRKPLANPPMLARPPSQQISPEAQLGHSRTRTTSSGIFPSNTASPTSAPPTNVNQQHQIQNQTGLRRTPTSSTTSTTATPNRASSGALCRSSSARSGSSPTSYVALLRKQKATVWCDRAQYEDPRMLAQQRQARMKANVEVAGGLPHAAPRLSSGGSGGGGVRSKFGRHHGIAKASLFAPTTHAASGVPLRLSATEVDEGGGDDAVSIGMPGGTYHHRTGSGRSSLGSGRRMSYANPAGRMSANSSPRNNTTPEELGDLDEESTPVPEQDEKSGYLLEHTKTSHSYESGSSEERNFGDMGQMPQNLPKPPLEKKNTEDLVRRGSVDERAVTLGPPRLYVANPDLSD